ncbi:MAG: DUF2817 domain-containing protein [Bdellovibrionales bacterium]|nr:DUF2817 domain-containing protein [Bdellovibrionales bacterium]
MLKFSFSPWLRALLILGLATLGGYAYWAHSPLPERADIVPTQYLRLKRDFIEGARSQSGEINSFILNSTGPNGEQLTIDTLWIGEKTAEKIFLHISGTHGVEGYAGSAIQSALLQEKLVAPDNSAIVFLHALNPWGMAHKRRVNESNVDLNRNFIGDKSKFSGSPQGYRDAEWFLNPEGLPSRMDLFFPNAIFLIGRYGFATLKQAIAGGQYDFPHGIYYGGSRMESSNRFLKRFLLQNFSKVKTLIVVEVHTGLGEWGKDLLFWPLDAEHPKTLRLSKLIDEKLDSDDPRDGAGFKTPGDLQGEAPKLLPDTDIYWIVQEFGTYGPIATLRALINENAYQQSAERPDTSHWSKAELLEIFTPGNAEWQQMVLDRGIAIGRKVIKKLADPLWQGDPSPEG